MRFKIITHNVFWLQGHPFASDYPGPPDPVVRKRLCSIYRDAQSDLLCMQEIQSSEAAAAIQETLRSEVRYVSGNRFPQYGLAAACLNADCVLETIPSEAVAYWERAFQILRVQFGDAGLMIANIHLTSGRQTGEANAPAVRLQELNRLLDHAPAPLDLIVGDFNEDAGGALSARLRSQGYADAAELAGKAGVFTSAIGKRDRIDQIWMTPRLRRCFVDYGVIRDEMRAANGDKCSALSDHCPIWASFEI